MLKKKNEVADTEYLLQEPLSAILFFGKESSERHLIQVNRFGPGRLSTV